MGIHRIDILRLGAGYGQKAVFHLQELFPYNVVLKLYQQVIHFIDNPRCGILNGKYGKVGAPLVDGAHCIPEGIYMKAVDSVRKIPFHGHLRISALRSLKYNAYLLCIKGIHTNKRKSPAASVLRQNLVLKLSAHSHNLFEQFADSLSVKSIVSHIPHSVQLLCLPCPVINFFACRKLCRRNLRTDFHARLVKLHNLSVNPVQPFSQI